MKIILPFALEKYYFFKLSLPFFKRKMLPMLVFCVIADKSRNVVITRKSKN